MRATVIAAVEPVDNRQRRKKLTAGLTRIPPPTPASGSEAPGIATTSRIPALVPASAVSRASVRNSSWLLRGRHTRGALISALARAPADSCHLRINRLDRIPRELDPLLATQQLQQDEHPFVRTQRGKHSDLFAQRAADHPHPHTRCEPARFRELDEPAALA